MSRLGLRSSSSFFFLISLVCSSVNEAIAAVFRLRAATLEAGIRGLIADETKADAFYNNWRIKTLFTRMIFRKDRRPSYIPPNVACCSQSCLSPSSAISRYGDG
jgi:hypothetical protein